MVVYLLGRLILMEGLLLQEWVPEDEGVHVVSLIERCLMMHRCLFLLDHAGSDIFGVTFCMSIVILNSYTMSLIYVDLLRFLAD